MSRGFQIAAVFTAVIILLVGPAILCAGPIAAPSHPCCPKAPAQQPDCGQNCCFDRLPATPPAPAALGVELSTDAAPTRAPEAELAVAPLGEFRTCVASPPDRVVTFQQLLL